MLRDQERWADLGGRLRVAAAIELKRDHPERSAVLLGAAMRWTDHPDFQDELLLRELPDKARLSARLEKKAMARAFERGAGLSPDEIIRMLEDVA